MGLRLTLFTVFMLVASIGLLRLNIVLVHSVVLAFMSLSLFGISIGFPVGYLLAGRRGAIVGGVCGALFVFAALYVLVEVLDLVS